MGNGESLVIKKLENPELSLTLFTINERWHPSGRKKIKLSLVIYNNIQPFVYNFIYLIFNAAILTYCVFVFAYFNHMGRVSQ